MKPIIGIEKHLKNLTSRNYSQRKRKHSMGEILTDLTSDQTDPTGKTAQEPGAKLDAGKNRMGLVLGDFASALQEVSKVGTVGANKYSPHGWLTVNNGVERYTDAMLRHYFEEANGYLLDAELTSMAGEPIHHAACVAWNALARLQLIINAGKDVEAPPF